VSVTILVELVRIPFKCAGLDDRAVAFAVVIPAKPQDDFPRKNVNHPTDDDRADECPDISNGRFAELSAKLFNKVASSR